MHSPRISLTRGSMCSFPQAVKQLLRQWNKADNHALILNAAMDRMQSKQELVLENVLLGQQLILLKRWVKRLALS